ncbi:hypothetical protein AB4Z22_37545 [Paenibacillus sp. TAF58]
MTAAHSRGYKDFLAALREYALSDVTTAIETMDATDVTTTALQQTLIPHIINFSELYGEITRSLSFSFALTGY